MRKRFRINPFKKISTAIVFPIILSLFVGSLCIVFIVVDAKRIAISNALNELRKSSTSLVINKLDSNLEQAIRMNEMHQKVFLRKMINFMDETQREKYFTTVLESNSEALMTFIGFPDGQFYGARKMMDGKIQVVRNNKGTDGSSMYYNINELGIGMEFYEKFDNFDPRNRPWYQTAVEQDKNSFTSIYRHFIYKEPTITASMPIYEDGELVAVFGVDYLMSWLGITLAELPIGLNGHVVVLNEKNEIISSTADKAIFYMKDDNMVNRNIEECNHPIEKAVNEIINNIKVGEFTKTKIGYNNYYIGLDSYNDHGLKWRIFTVISENDFSENLRLVYYRTFFLILFFISIFITFIIYITRLLVNPILNLNMATRNLLEGHFEEVRTGERKDEIGILMKNFNIMGGKLTRLLNDLEYAVQKRTEELERKNELLRSISYLDELSGISNRRKFNEYASHIVDVATRKKINIAILLIDIDLFKNYNDTYGHVAGDHCITRVGELLKSIIRRQTDLSARYGGEEFAIILLDVNIEYAKEVAEDIRSGMEKMMILNEGTPLGILTVSIGIYCGIPEVGQSLEEVTAKADEALYKAKSLGRNNVYVYDN